MLKTVEDISATKKRLKIEISADTIEKEIQDSLEKVRKTAALPGFRTGKAPIGLVEKKFGKRVEEEVLDRMIPQVYADSLKKADITPVADPVIEEAIDFKRHRPVSMTITVEIMPKMEHLIYEGMTVKEIETAVDDADVDSVLKRSQEERASYEPSEGPVTMDDLVSFDYSAKDNDLEVKDQVFKVGGSLFPEEFSRKLIGLKKGDELRIETTFPEGHLPEKLSGKSLAVDVVMKDIKKISLPVLDDEFAKDMGFETLGALKEHVRNEVLKAKKNEAARIQKAELLKKLLDSHDFDVPESLLEGELAALVSRETAKGDGEETASDAETLKERLHPDAVRNVKASLLLSAIGRKEKVVVSEDDLKNAIISMAMRFGVPPEKLMKFYLSRDGSLESLKNSLFEEKVLDLILSKAVAEKGA
ncbi:MAG TPA: trigger factor [Thermodesulfovibrionales bacterium]|nr:trigger factor [Thermodesulfovibrionales bacterium]